MDWETLEASLDRLSHIIAIKPDLIVGVVRGGVVPARILATKLGVKDMHCITVKKDGDERNVTAKIDEPIAGKLVLVVEDMLETGGSLLAAKDYLLSEGADVKTAVIFVHSSSKVRPDYYLDIKDKVPLFPWERS